MEKRLNEVGKAMADMAKTGQNGFDAMMKKLSEKYKQSIAVQGLCTGF
ncbi:hypothetical protein FOMA001_g1482 [Fusarium oxysporum f. sp. matthiolae]|jgi:hypothetical protein|nr:hypothetical protein FOMA001_g1482 [Fusarium oxysporum f. sp. matthiolae]